MDSPVLVIYADNSIQAVWLPAGISVYGLMTINGMAHWFMQNYVYNKPVKCVGIVFSQVFDYLWQQVFESSARGYAPVYSAFAGEFLEQVLDTFLQETEEVDPVMCKLHFNNLGLVNV
jgi:hypothetical protein